MSQRTRVPGRRANSIRPRLEALEDRTVPSAYVGSTGDLNVIGTAVRDEVKVTNVVIRGTSYYEVSDNSGVYDIPVSSVRTGLIRFWGYEGDDTFKNMTGTASYANGGPGNDYLLGGTGVDTLYGLGGDDSLAGGYGNDVFYGGDGRDTLYGGEGEDRLYGGVGTDFLYGDGGDDFLDAGSRAESVVGGAGYDYDAYRPVVNGATWTDPIQGNAATCWLVSSISSAALRGEDFASRITYLGNNTFRVMLYDVNTLAETYQYVTFDGGRYGADAAKSPTDDGEFWPLLVQRAFLQSEAGQSVTNPNGGWANNCMTAFSGRHFAEYYGDGTNLYADALDQIEQAIADGKNVAAGTWSDPAKRTDALVGNHVYTVVRVERDVAGNRFVVMRNPWGSDGGTQPAGEDTTDGIVRVSEADFRRSMAGYTIT